MQALDIFAQFFVSPLMKADSSDRELQSIESEFCLSKNSDSCRLQELWCHTCKRGERETERKGMDTVTGRPVGLFCVLNPVLDCCDLCCSSFFEPFRVYSSLSLSRERLVVGGRPADFSLDINT